MVRLRRIAPYKDGAAAAKQIAEIDKHPDRPLINKDGVFGKHSGKEQSVTDKIRRQKSEEQKSALCSPDGNSKAPQE